MCNVDGRHTRAQPRSKSWEGGGVPKLFFHAREGKVREWAQVIIGAPKCFLSHPIIILIVVTNKNALV